MGLGAVLEEKLANPDRAVSLESDLQMIDSI